VKKLTYEVEMDCDNNLLKKIMDAVDQHIKPSLQMDGGDMEIVSLKGNALLIKLLGACSGCPRARETMKYGIERTLRQIVSEDIFVVPSE
jgi:Fe-S cluster biogenesis protein NfuA